MSLLDSATLDFAQAELELDRFRTWLGSHDEFIEREAIEQLKPCRNLCLLVGMAAGRGLPDRIKHEFAIQGAFRADLVVGCSSRRHFVLVEFEGGMPGSVFNRARRKGQLRDWGAELQHGFSQVSDWTWAKNDGQHTALYRNAFGFERLSETYIVVCGRDAHLDEIDRSRLFWRSEKTSIAGCGIRFWTYDDLLGETSNALDAYRAVRVEQQARPRPG